MVKNGAFNKMCWENWLFYRKKVDYYSYIKINFRKIKDSNVKGESLKFQEEHIGQYLHDSSGGRGCWEGVQ